MRILLFIRKVVLTILRIVGSVFLFMWVIDWVVDLTNWGCWEEPRIGFTESKPPPEYQNAEQAQVKANEILASFNIAPIKVTTDRPLKYYLFPGACASYHSRLRIVWLKEPNLDLSTLLHELSHELDEVELREEWHGKSFWTHYATLSGMYGSATVPEIVASIGVENIEAEWIQQFSPKSVGRIAK